MKKLYLLLIAVVFSVSAIHANAAQKVSAPVNDYGLFFKPYVGADYQFVSPSYQNVPSTAFNFGDFISDSFSGAHIHAGARVHKNLGLEFGYLWTANETKSNLGITTKANVSGVTFDGLGYIPLESAPGLELIGTVGVSRLKADIKVTLGALAGASSQSEWGFRFGGGAQYWLTDNINARAIVRYQTADFSGILDNAVMVNAGLNYQFQ